MAAQEHRDDAAQLARLCSMVLAGLPNGLPDDLPDNQAGDDGVAEAVRRSLTALGRDLERGCVPHEQARIRLRRLVASAGAVRGGDHAQSPAAASGIPAERADPWDYRRDRHHEGAAWERLWIDAVVGQRSTSRPTALLTGCGMAAMTTVLALLERETGRGPILVDDATYHETRHLLATGGLAGRVRSIPGDHLATAAVELQAAAVVVDAVSNSPGVRLADLPRLAEAMDRIDDRSRSGGSVPVLVVDATVCSMAAAPVRRLLSARYAAGPTAPRHRTIVVESLTKHAQHGLDRVAAGVIVATGPDVDALDLLREHLGTNIADLVCLLLLPPDPTLLGRRLARIGRNAELVAERLAAAGAPVVHPSRPDHPDHHRWLGDRPSCGLVTLPDDACSEDLLDRWLQQAQARGVPLDHGAGFGFDTTRVYRPGGSLPEASRFVRIAPGAEPLDSVLAVCEVLVSAWR